MIGSLFELPSMDLSLSIILVLALVFAEYSEILSFLKNGVPFEKLFLSNCGLARFLFFPLKSFGIFKSESFLLTIFSATYLSSFLSDLFFLT